MGKGRTRLGTGREALQGEGGGSSRRNKEGVDGAMRFWRPIMCSRSPTDRAGNVITRPWLAACLVYSQHATIAKRRRALSRLRLAGLCNAAAALQANCASAMHFARHKPKSRFRLRAVHFPLLCRTSFYIILLGLTRDLWLLGRQRDGLLCAALAAGGRGRCWLLEALVPAFTKSGGGISEA